MLWFSTLLKVVLLLWVVPGAQRLGAGGAEVGDTFLTELPGGGGDERDEPSNTTGRDDEDEEGEDPDFDRLPAGRKATLEWHRFWSHPNMQLDTLPRIQHKHFYLVRPRSPPLAATDVARMRALRVMPRRPELAREYIRSPRRRKNGVHSRISVRAPSAGTFTDCASA